MQAYGDIASALKNLKNDDLELVDVDFHDDLIPQIKFLVDKLLYRTKVFLKEFAAKKDTSPDKYYFATELHKKLSKIKTGLDAGEMASELWYVISLIQEKRIADIKKRPTEKFKSLVYRATKLTGFNHTFATFLGELEKIFLDSTVINLLVNTFPDKCFPIEEARIKITKEHDQYEAKQSAELETEVNDLPDEDQTQAQVQVVIKEESDEDSLDDLIEQSNALLRLSQSKK